MLKNRTYNDVFLTKLYNDITSRKKSPFDVDADSLILLTNED
jgi:hypothetical protein